MSSILECVERLDLEATLVESDDPAAARAKWQEAQQLAEAQAEALPGPEWSYIAGYVGYMLVSRNSGSFARTEKFLLAGREPGHWQPLAEFYLAALYFDAGQWLIARAWLEHIKRAGRYYFKDWDQEWRYVKSVEMLVAVHIRMGAWSDANHVAAWMEVAYINYAESESMVPISLVGALADARAEDAVADNLSALAVRIVRRTRSVAVIGRLFPGFAQKWLGEANEVRPGGTGEDTTCEVELLRVERHLEMGEYLFLFPDLPAPGSWNARTELVRVRRPDGSQMESPAVFSLSHVNISDPEAALDRRWRVTLELPGRSSEEAPVGSLIFVTQAMRDALMPRKGEERIECGNEAGRIQP